MHLPVHFGQRENIEALIYGSLSPAKPPAADCFHYRSKEGVHHPSAVSGLCVAGFHNLPESHDVMPGPCRHLNPAPHPLHPHRVSCIAMQGPDNFSRAARSRLVDPSRNPSALGTSMGVISVYGGGKLCSTSLQSNGTRLIPQRLPSNHRIRLFPSCTMPRHRSTCVCLVPCALEIVSPGLIHLRDARFRQWRSYSHDTTNVMIACEPPAAQPYFWAGV